MKKFTKDYFTKKDLKELSNDYSFVVTCKDKFLSGWGKALGKNHYQIILCKDKMEKDLILNDVKNDNTLSFINWYPLSEVYFNNIMQKQYKNSVTLRNDWDRIYS